MPKTRLDSRQFHSILFESPTDRIGDNRLEAPKFFADLNCDQIVNAITAGRDDYNLTPFFYALLPRVDAIEYRHEVIRDLERSPLYERVSSFAAKMRSMREHLVQTEKMYYKEQKQAWFLDGVETYCEAVRSFAAELADSDLRSQGLLRFLHYLDDYSRSAAFDALLSQAKMIKDELATVQYCVLIKGAGFTVRKYEGEADYSVEVERTFDKFKQGAAKDYKVKFSVSAEMDHIEAKILEFVAKLYAEVFRALDDFHSKNGIFMDRTIAVFDREVQFYLAYLEYTAPMRRAGLSFCYPRVSDKGR